jgi:hypothetical protein
VRLHSEKPSAFVPDNAGGDWFWVDVPALAAAANLPRSTPLVEVVVPHADASRYPMARAPLLASEQPSAASDACTPRARRSRRRRARCCALL